jgi:serine protease Do
MPARPAVALSLVLVAGGALAQPVVPAAPDLRAYSEHQRPRVTPLVELVRRSRDAVVNVAATQVMEVRDPFFDFFDTTSRRRMNTSSVGSGAIIHPAGYVLTNAHVVAQASELKVILADGTELPAEVVASMQEDDLAILKVTPRAPLSALPLGRSGDLMVGETVVAIGNPLGLQHTVTTGIVSALGRELELGKVKFTDIVQTDAAINPGNSGGPLLNILGELVGVNTAIRGDAQNVGFAIPVNRVKARLPQLLGVKTRGRVQLGIGWGPEQGQGAGVIIERVEPNSPAQRAKLQAGQVVTAIAGRRVPSLIDALVTTLEQPVGRPFALAVRDHGQGGEREVRVTVEELPAPDGPALALAKFGVRLVELTDGDARRFGLRRRAGLRVTEVRRGSPAALAGLATDDIVLQLDRFGVPDAESLGLVLEQVKSGDEMWAVVVRSRGRTLYRSTVVLQAR